MNDFKKKKAMRLMYRVSVQVSRLYAVFADNFPGYDNFWRELADEEMRHADVLQKIYLAEINGFVQINDKSIDENRLSDLIDKIEEVISEVQQNKTNKKIAINYTKALFNLINEKNIMERFNGIDQSIVDAAFAVDDASIPDFYNDKNIMAAC